MHVHTHKHTHTVMSKLLKKDIQYFDMSPQDRCGSVLVYALLISACGGAGGRAFVGQEWGVMSYRLQGHQLLLDLLPFPHQL